MREKLRILLLEDDAADAELIARELEASGFLFRLIRVQTELDLRRELELQPPDLVLSDHRLLAFHGFKALDIVQRVRPDLPFIFVSDSNDQGMVTQMHEAGATDYVFKRDLGDLKATVLRALEKVPLAAEAPARPRSEPPPAPVQPPVEVASGPTRLWFCPGCQRARDGEDLPVYLLNFLRNHTEVVITRRTCMACEMMRIAAAA